MALLATDHIPLVNFLIIGAQKSGTSALADFLKTHPQIAFAKKWRKHHKEVHYFDNDKRFSRPLKNHKFYHKYFRHTKKHHKAIGEATPVYIYWEPALRRIYDYNPAMKLIVLLRNPVERAYSQYQMCKSKGEVTCSFREMLDRELEMRRVDPRRQSPLYSCLSRGHYVS